MGDMFGSHIQRSSSYSDDYNRESLRSKLLGQPSLSVSSDSLYMPDNYTSTYGYHTMLADGPSFNEMPLNYSMDTLNWTTASDNGNPIFEDNMLQFEIGSSNASYAASMYEGDSMYDGELVQSPTSPTFSSAASHCSEVMSPQMSIQDAVTPPAGNDYDDTMSEQAESDEVLESLLGELEPADDGRYYCQDVNADGHACDFSAERKCMLRKHLESTLKTNICRHPDCGMIQFSSKAVLTRHEKEAHGMHAASQYFCPVSSCERHTRGFPREYNMGDHIQRVHRELDVNAYLKKGKRVRKTSNSSSHGTGRSTSAVRKQSGAKARRERIEKQYRSSRETIGKLAWKLPEQNGEFATKYIQQLKAEVARLEEANNASLQTND